MTEETLKKANELSAELKESRFNLKILQNQLKHPHNIEDINLYSYVRYGNQHSVMLPKITHMPIAEIIIDEYEVHIAELQKKLDEL